MCVGVPRCVFTVVFKFSRGAAGGNDIDDEEEVVVAASGARAELGFHRTNVVVKQWRAAVWCEVDRVNTVYILYSIGYMLCTGGGGGGVRLDGFRERRSLRDGGEGAFTKKE